MKTIIAPVDFFSVSDNASLFAAKMAEDIKADLLLLHVAELPVGVAEYPVTEEVFEALNMEQELENLKNKLLAATNNRVSIQTKNIVGSVEYEIKELCDEKKPFAIVMATHSYNTVDRFFAGSTTVYSAKHLPWPVLVIPANTQYKHIKKIALASDLKDIYEVPVEEIENIVRCFNAEFEIFYAAKNETTINRDSIGSVLLDHRLIQLNPQFYAVEDEDIMRGITALAEKHEIDILMVIPKKHGPFHKSQSKDFIYYSPVPIMTVHKNNPVHHS